MIRKTILAGLLLFNTQAFAQTPQEIFCTMYPRLFVGNVHMHVNVQKKIFEITYDEVTQPGRIGQTVAATGTIYVQEKDSMGFERVSLCTSEPCSGPTYLGDLKAADNEQGRHQDRSSYLRLNPHAEIKVKVKRFDREQELRELSQLECRFN